LRCSIKKARISSRVGGLTIKCAYLIADEILLVIVQFHTGQKKFLERGFMIIPSKMKAGVRGEPQESLEAHPGQLMVREGQVQVFTVTVLNAEGQSGTANEDKAGQSGLFPQKIPELFSGWTQHGKSLSLCC
jgi:hypothetical protein